MGVRVGLRSVGNGWLLPDGARWHGVWVRGLLVMVGCFFVKSPNLFKIWTSIVVNTGTLVTMNHNCWCPLNLYAFRAYRPLISYKVSKRKHE